MRPSLLLPIMAWLNTLPLPDRPNDFVEAFAGEGLFTQGLIESGLHGVKMDVRDSKNFNIFRTVGLCTLLAAVHHTRRGGLLMTAPPCSTWVWLSRGSTKRSLVDPGGNRNLKCVYMANVLIQRLCYVLYYAWTRGVHFCIEQPTSSLLFDYKPMKRLLRMTGARKVCFPMGAFGAETLKMTQLWSTLPALEMIRRRVKFKYVRCMLKRSGKKDLVKRYIDKKGRSCLQGDMRKLAYSAVFPVGFGYAMAPLISAALHEPGYPKQRCLEDDSSSEEGKPKSAVMRTKEALLKGKAEKEAAAAAAAKKLAAETPSNSKNEPGQGTKDRARSPSVESLLNDLAQQIESAKKEKKEKKKAKKDKSNASSPPGSVQSKASKASTDAPATEATTATKVKRKPDHEAGAAHGISNKEKKDKRAEDGGKVAIDPKQQQQQQQQQTARTEQAQSSNRDPAGAAKDTKKAKKEKSQEKQKDESLDKHEASDVAACAAKKLKTDGSCEKGVPRDAEPSPGSNKEKKDKNKEKGKEVEGARAQPEKPKKEKSQEDSGAVKQPQKEKKDKTQENNGAAGKEPQKEKKEKAQENSGASKEPQKEKKDKAQENSGASKEPQKENKDKAQENSGVSKQPQKEKKDKTQENSGVSKQPKKEKKDKAQENSGARKEPQKEKKDRAQENSGASKEPKKEKKDKAQENSGATSKEPQKEKKDKTQENSGAASKEPQKKKEQTEENSGAASKEPHKNKDKTEENSGAASKEPQKKKKDKTEENSGAASKEPQKEKKEKTEENSGAASKEPQKEKKDKTQENSGAAQKKKDKTPENSGETKPPQKEKKNESEENGATRGREKEKKESPGSQVPKRLRSKSKDPSRQTPVESSSATKSKKDKKEKKEKKDKDKKLKKEKKEKKASTDVKETTDANSSPSSTTVPESATDSPPNSTTGGDSTSESTPSGLRRRLEDDFQESPEPPSKVPRLNTMDSFSFGSNSSDTPPKQQLFEDKQAQRPAQGTRRVTQLSEEEKGKILAMASNKDMPRPERKRQYAALRRAILRNANPALTAKMCLCNDGDRFGMLKTFIVQQSVASIEVEECYHSWVRELRSDKYVTVTVFQLEKIYGTSPDAQNFIKALITGQAGTPHPQAPDSVKGRMYKVLKEVVEEKQTGSEGKSQMKLGGRVNEASAKKLLAKQLGEFAGNLESIGFLDVKTGRISGKKQKKALTPEQQTFKDMKLASNKLENQSKTIPAKLAEIEGLKIRNCTELVAALHDMEGKVETALNKAKDMLEGQKTCPDVEGWTDFMEQQLTPVINLADHDIKDASKRIQNHKNTEKNKMKANAATANDEKEASDDEHGDDDEDEDEESG